MLSKKLIFSMVFALAGILSAQAASVSGPTTVQVNCVVTYNVTGCQGGFIFWSGPSAMQVISGGTGSSSITVRFTSAGSFGFFVGGGCSVSYNVNVFDSPTISGPATGCAFGTSVYTVPLGYSNLTWSVNVAVQSAVVSGNTYTIKWTTPSSTNATVSATYQTSACGTYSLTRPVVIENQFGGTINGPSTTNAAFPYDYQIAGSNHNWTANGGTLNALQQGTNTMRITWGCGASGSVSVTYVSPAGCTRQASLNVTITPIIPTLTVADAFPITEYCYKASRTFVTDPGYGTYTWQISGMVEGSPNIITQGVAKPASDANRHTFNITSGSNFYGNVTVRVSYEVVPNCSSNWRSQSMTVTPATVNFRGSATAVPTVCYSDSQNIGDYSTDAGFSNYTWIAGNVSGVGSGTSTAAAQTTNMNWASLGNGGRIPITVTYSKSILNCVNTNLARDGVVMRKPSMVQATTTPLPINLVGQSVLFSSTELDGNEWAWFILPQLGRFTDSNGNNSTPNSGSTWVTWDLNNEPGPFPTVSANYWLYYPQSGGTRISYCTGASKQVDIRACGTCTQRQSSDSSPVINSDGVIEPGVFQAYPTPADNELWLRNVSLGARIELISMTGAPVVSVEQDQESLIKKIDTRSLNTGVYLLKTLDIDLQPVLMRLVIKH